MKLRVESTETGEVFNLRLETSIDKLKLQVKLFTQIPPQDQILLIGPPYKILDSQYGSNLKLEGKRVFVFNRRILTDENLEHNRLRLLPFEVTKLQFNDDLVNNVMKSPSPSSQYLLEFERYFQEQLKRGQCYELFIKEAFASCKAAVTQHQVQLDGIDAAILNLKDTYQAVKKPYDLLENRLTTQQSSHRVLLENFDSNLNKLLDTPLHPALVREMDRLRSEAESNGQQSTVFNNGTPTRSLYDCIPVERERAYHRQCDDSYNKVQEQLQRVHHLYESVAQGVGELSLPEVDFPRLNQLVETLSAEVDGESASISEMRRNYQFVYDIITAASSLDSTLEDANFAQLMGGLDINRSSSSTVTESAQLSSSPPSTASSQQMSTSRQAPLDLEALVSDMARRKFNQERQQFLSAMEQRVVAVKAIKLEVEDSQNALVRAIYSTMRRIARFQTDIQYRLKRDVEWMRKWTSGHNEYFKHLEHLAQLPGAYQHLLHEIVRRKAYNGVFEGDVSGAIDKIGALRSGEIRERELFMSSFGMCLPPVFFRIVPTLKDKPPYFNPSVTEEQWLPDVHYDDLNRQELMGLDSSGGYIYSNQQQHQQLSRLSKQTSSGAVNSGSDDNAFDEQQSDSAALLGEALPVASSRGQGRFSSQSDIDNLLNGGNRIRSNNNLSAMGEMDASTNNASSTPESGASRGVNAEGGSMILPAMNAPRQDDSYEELLGRYNRQTYENAKLLSVVEDLRRQLLGAEGGRAKKVRSMSLDSPLPLPTIVEVASPDPASESSDPTSGIVLVHTEERVQSSSDVTSDLLGVDQVPVRPTSSSEGVLEETEKVEEMEMQSRVDELMAAFFEVRHLLDRDAYSRAFVDSLASHGHLKAEEAAELGVFHNDRQCVADSSTRGSFSSGGGSSQTVGAVVREVVQLASSVSQALSQVIKFPLISFMDFKVGDIVLFMPQAVDNRDVWVAFNSSQPYRFLSDTSLDSFKASSKRGENRKYILGRIVLIDQFTAGDKVNPYQLPQGTLFYVCHCEALARRDISGGVTAPRWTSPIASKAGAASRSSSSSSAVAITITSGKMNASLPTMPQTPAAASAGGGKSPISGSKSEVMKKGGV